ncbi:MAG: methyltransferase domain-containing protein [Acidobacteriota bacterium]
MSGPAAWRRVKLWASMMRYGRSHNRKFAREHLDFYERLERDIEPRLGALRDLRVLEVGCGKMSWLTLLLHSAGARASGFDTEWVEMGFKPSKYWSLWRANGLERALRTFAWDVFFARTYYRELGRIAPFPLRFDGLDVHRMSVTDMDFEPESFDLIVSHEVFEHLPDIDGALAGLERVMKPGALTYLYIHSFTSISGGHHIAWKKPDTEPSQTVPPWDHLRERRFPDIPSWINGWREHQYRASFDARFEVLEWIHTEREGEALLTPEIRAELSDYSEEELLTKGFIAIVRRRPGDRAGADADAGGGAALRGRSGGD